MGKKLEHPINLDGIITKEGNPLEKINFINLSDNKKKEAIEILIPEIYQTQREGFNQFTLEFNKINSTLPVLKHNTDNIKETLKELLEKENITIEDSIETENMIQLSFEILSN